MSKTCKKPRSQANQRKQNKTSRPRSDIDIGTQKLRPHKRSNVRFSNQGVRSIQPNSYAPNSTTPQLRQTTSPSSQNLVQTQLGSYPTTRQHQSVKTELPEQCQGVRLHQVTESYQVYLQQLGSTQLHAALIDYSVAAIDNAATNQAKSRLIFYIFRILFICLCGHIIFP